MISGLNQNTLLGFILLLIASSSYGLELLGGGGLVEQGDFVVRPTVMGQVSSKPYFLGLSSYGRQFGPVKEISRMVFAGAEAEVFSRLPLKGRFGLSSLVETTELAYEGSEVQSEQSVNLGGLLGVSWKISDGGLKILAVWDSHIYPAGTRGGSLLATGRKQVIAIIGGFDL